MAQSFLRRRLQCEKFTTDDDDDGRRTKPDGKSSHGLWPSELRTKLNCNTNFENTFRAKKQNSNFV